MTDLRRKEKNQVFSTWLIDSIGGRAQIDHFPRITVQCGPLTRNDSQEGELLQGIMTINACLMHAG